jgi:hypothetical protein
MISRQKGADFRAFFFADRAHLRRYATPALEKLRDNAALPNAAELR